MTTIKLKGINKVPKRLANGTIKTYYYHRATGTLLPGLPGSPNFLKAYEEAERPFSHDTGTVSELIRLYLASFKFDKKRASTQREYRRALAAIEAGQVPGKEKGKTFGTMPIAALGARGVAGMFTDYQEQIALEHPREADNRLIVLSIVFGYAKKKGRIARNPLEGFERLYRGDRSELIWTEVEIKTFMAGAPVELQRALILALHTGQRYGDLVRLRWSDYDSAYVRLKQSKTKATVTVKASAALKRMLDTTPKSGPYILTRANGKPWFTEKADDELGAAWRERMIASGLHDESYLANAMNDPELKGVRLHFNDLRGTAVTLLAEAGCTIPEIVSITGHTLKSATTILEKYMARTRTLSDAAILKFENAPAADFANRLQTAETA